MDKQSPQKLAIEKCEQPSSLVRTEKQEKAEVISEYLEKYALIANRALTPQLLSLYVEALADLPLNRIKAGLKEWLQEGDRFPWPSELRQASEL